MEHGEQIECRPRADGLVIGLVLLFVGAGLCALPWLVGSGRGSGEDLALALLAGAPVLLAGACCALFSLRARIVADAAGLRWRGLGRWRSAPWEDVTDYHWYFSARVSPGGYVLRVETRAGAVGASAGQWIGTEAMQERVARCATAARAPGWELRRAAQRPARVTPRRRGRTRRDD